MRKSGILMHITSLPSPYGIGSLGKYAYDFIDFLREAGQAYWQILPLSPTGYGDSPYQAFSAFAGNHYLIDLDILIAEGLLTQQEADAVCWGENEHRVDFGRLYAHRSDVLKLAYRRFVADADYDRFVSENAAWLPDYALFMALKGKHGGIPWQQWEKPLMLRDRDTLESCRKELDDEIRFHCFLQYQFFAQWSRLHAYANRQGIRIIGDVPIYVPLDSADCWANPQNFLLDESGCPTAVAGCPPDTFAVDGQLWGNPLYDWERMKKEGYAWWIDRLSAATEMYDVVRLDHFRGFESYWAVPAGEQTAAGGTWQQGPGMGFIRAIQSSLQTNSMIAEDLGFVTPQVQKLQRDSGYPGMKVIQFGFDSREEGDYLPHAYPENSVCYTGTHDNATLAQWFEDALAADVAVAKAYLGLNEEEGYVRGVIRGCMASASKLCIIQMQDYLELGAEARMNIPGTLSAANWTWRVERGFISEALTERIRKTTKLFGRA